MRDNFLVFFRRSPLPHLSFDEPGSPPPPGGTWRFDFRKNTKIWLKILGKNSGDTFISYCYYLVKVFSLGLSKSDHINRISLYLCNTALYINATDRKVI